MAAWLTPGPGSSEQQRFVFATGLNERTLELVLDWCRERGLELIDGGPPMPAGASDVPPDPVLVLVGGSGGSDALETVSAARAESVNTPLFFVDDGPTPMGTSAALLAGADDAARPQDDAESFLARLDARLRRASGIVGRVIQLGPLFVDVANQRIVLGGVNLDLRNAEFKLLAYLAAHAARAVPAAELRNIALHTYADDHTVRNHVYELRRKLRRCGFPDLIRTLPGVGYKLSIPPSAGFPR